MLSRSSRTSKLRLCGSWWINIGSGLFRRSYDAGEPPVTAEGGLGTSAPALLKLLPADLEAAGLLHFLPGWHKWVMEASRADFEFAARSARPPPDP